MTNPLHRNTILDPPLRGRYIENQAYSEYKHVLVNILRSRYVARTPPLEARSPGRRSNVKNAPRRRLVTSKAATPTSLIRRQFEKAPLSAAGHQPAARADPAERSHYVIISRDGRKLVTMVRIVTTATQPVPRLQIRPIVHN